MENFQNVAAEAAQNAAMQQVVNPANGAEVQADVPAAPNEADAPKEADAPAEVAVEQPKTLLEIAQLGSKEEGFKLQCEKFGKILTDSSLAELEKKARKRLDALKTYQSNLESLLVEIHQKQAVERFDEIKAILADLTPEQKQQLGVA